jgi:soluble lytic murein transglycosylase-like protein
MVTSLFTASAFTASAALGNNTLRYCLILMLAAPAFAASPGGLPQGHITTTVRADAKTGRLVRSTVVPPLAVQPLPSQLRAVSTKPASPQLDEMIDSIADAQGVENHLVHSVIRAESDYNANAVSPKGAQGLMQLIPATARRFGVANAFDVKENIEGGVRYLRFLLDYYQGDYPKAIAAYNAGEGAVDKYHGIPPFAETQNYVFRVARNLRAARQTVRPALASTRAPVLNAETTRPIKASAGPDGRIYYRTP